MPETRNLLLIALAVVGLLLWSQWQRDYYQPPAGGEADSGQPTAAAERGGATLPQGEPAGEPADESELPDVTALPEAEPVQQPAPAGGRDEPTIRVRTDVLDVTIDLQGGTIIGARLLQYPVAAGRPEQPVQLMQVDQGEYYVAQSGLLSTDRPAPDHRRRYRAARRDYRLEEGADELRVVLEWREGDLSAEKVLIFRRDSYVIDVRHRLQNRSPDTWRGVRYAQLQRSKPEPAGGGLANTSRYSFKGAVYHTAAEQFSKLQFDDFANKSLVLQGESAWVGLSEHYFLSAVIPPGDSSERLETVVTGSPSAPRYLIRTVGPAIEVPPGGAHEFPLRLFIGPKVHDRLEGLAPRMALTIDYGIFTIFSKPLFWALNKIHAVIGNWGWAIVILTILIKLAFFKLTESQYRSMARMRKLQPRMEKLKERYGDDRQKMSQAMMELYRTEKVNPLGGCLPILVQIPIFIALYWVLLESVELRQAPFVGWIQDLSSPDPYFILPVINGAAMIATQRMTPTPGMDPTQRKIMNALPIIFSVLFAFFPAGLVLYWATNATISLAQQWVITRRIEKIA